MSRPRRLRPILTGLWVLSLFLPSLAAAAPVDGRLLVELSSPGARAWARGEWVPLRPPGGEDLDPRLEPLFPGKAGDLSRFFLLHFRADLAGAGRPVENRSWIEALRRSPEVLRVQEDQVFRVSSLPEDPFFLGDGSPPRQFHLFDPGGLSLQAFRAWPFVPAGRPIPVAVLDSGVDWRHPDLGGFDPPSGGVLAVNGAEAAGLPGVDDDLNGFVDDVVGWDFVELTGVSLPAGASPAPGEDPSIPDADPSDVASHGTEVAGLVTAISGNGYGVAGGSPPARILPVRIGWRGVDGSAYVLMSFCAQGLVYAAENGARVANCSWNSADLDGLGAALDFAVQDHDMVIVGSAGNNATSSTSIQYLASRGDCLGVAGLDADGSKAGSSNFGAWVDIAAFFKGMATTTYDYGSASSAIGSNFSGGTSFSAPQITGLAAMLRAIDPSATGAQVRSIIRATGRDLSDLDPVYGAQLGGGLADWAHAVQALGGGWDRAQPARSLLPLPAAIAYFGDGGLELWDADSARAVPAWEAGGGSFVSPDSGSMPAYLELEGNPSLGSLIWVAGDTLHARRRDGVIPPGFPLPLPAGAGSPLVVPGEPIGLGRILHPVPAGIFDVEVSQSGVDTATVPGPRRGLAAARVSSGLWVAGLDEAGNLRLSRTSGGASAETTLVLGPDALPPVVGEFARVFPLAVTVFSDSVDPGNSQRIVFADPDFGRVREIIIPGPPIQTLSLAGFAGLLRLEAVAVDGFGRIHLAHPDGTVRSVDAGGALAGEPLCADLDGDYRSELVAVRADGRVLAWDESLVPAAGFPREFPFPIREAAVIGDGGARRYAFVSDTTGVLWALPLGPAGGLAPWTAARGGPGRSGFLGFDPATPVELLGASLSWQGSGPDGPICWQGTGFEILIALRLRTTLRHEVLWEGPPAPESCRLVAGLDGEDGLVLEGLHRRDGWVRLAEAEGPDSGRLRLGMAGPNPFRGGSRVTWSGAEGPVRMEIFDVRGRRVWSTRVNGSRGETIWPGLSSSGGDAPPGVYFLRATAGARQATLRLVKLP